MFRHPDDKRLGGYTMAFHRVAVPCFWQEPPRWVLKWSAARGVSSTSPKEIFRLVRRLCKCCVSNATQKKNCNDARPHCFCPRLFMWRSIYEALAAHNDPIPIDMGPGHEFANSPSLVWFDANVGRATPNKPRCVRAVTSDGFPKLSRPEHVVRGSLTRS